MPTHRAPTATHRYRWAPLALTAALLGACGSTHSTSTPTTAPTSTPTSNRAPTTPAPGPTTTVPSGPALSTSPPPWPLPADAVPYIHAAGLEALSTETLAVHYHAHLDIVVGSQAVPVPPGIGFVVTNGQATALSSLHTHDETGIIHIESPKDSPFTLGQIFTEWGVKLTAGQMGGLRDGGGDELRLYVNGVRQTTAPQSLVLRPHQEIVLWYGPANQQPTVPASYAFPSGD